MIIVKSSNPRQIAYKGKCSPASFLSRTFCEDHRDINKKIVVELYCKHTQNNSLKEKCSAYIEDFFDDFIIQSFFSPTTSEYHAVDQF